jgi:endonuclease/exonuclease/phosphatase (EEP) superfamily protein YafD
MTILFWNLLVAATLLACLSTLAGFFGRTWWVFELTSHFHLQYFIFLIISSVLHLVAGNPYFGLAASIFALLNFSMLLPFFRSRPNNHSDVKTYRVLLANILKRNQSYARVRETIHSCNPDFAVLIEVSQKWMQELDCLRSTYPFIKSAPRTDDYGLALFSRFPIKQAEIEYFGDTDRPTIIAQIDLAGQMILLVIPHPSPPKSKPSARLRNQQLHEFAQYLDDRTGPKFLIGDLNITPWSPYFRDLLDQSGLRQSRRGFGLQPTWPTTMPALYIPIDHILVSQEIKIHKHRLGPRLGSDHRPVIVDFSINQQN